MRGQREHRSSRAVALLQAAMGGIGRCRLEAATVFALTLAAASLAALAPGTGAVIPPPAGLTAAGWALVPTAVLELAAALATLAAVGGIGAGMVRSQRPRLDLLEALGLTPRQLALVAGLQPVAAGAAGAALGGAGAVLATRDTAPAVLLPALGGAALCCLLAVAAGGVVARGAARPDTQSSPRGRRRRRPSLRTWALPVSIAIGAAARRDPSLRGLRRLLPLLVGLDALLRELVIGGRTVPLTWPEWHRSLLPPGRLGLVANVLLALVALGYLGTLLLRTSRRRATLAVVGAMGATRRQLLVAAVLPAVFSPLVGLVLASLAVAALRLSILPPTDVGSVTVALRPSVLIPSAAALVGAVVGAVPRAWRGTSTPLS